jgi:hypothetical protein
MIKSQKTITQRKQRTKRIKKPESELIKIFWDAPLDALFGQETIAPVVNRQIKTLESDRWRGQGILYRKCSGRVLYKKADVIAWIESHQLVSSTSEYEVRHA